MMDADRTQGGPGPRVAVVAYTEYPWDPRVRREAETLASDGYAVHVIALRPRSGPSPSHLGGVHLHEVPLGSRRGGRLRYAYQYGLFLVLSTVLLVRLHLRRRFELVHVHSLPDFQVLCALPLKVSRVPVILDLHEAMPEIIAARFRTSTQALLPRIAAFLEGCSVRFADHVIAANDGIRSAVVGRGLPAARITAVYNASDFPPGGVDPVGLRQRLGLPDGRLLVHAGGINPERDLETLLRAMAQLPADADACLVIAGDGESAYTGALKTLAATLGIGDRVRFVGRLPIEEARALMTLSEIGLITLEANPLTELAWPSRIPEFAALGKPLIVPRLSFLQSVLENGAQYYAPGDAGSLAREIGGALTEPEKTARAAEKAGEICRRFEWRQMRRVLLGVYHALGASNAG